MADKKTVGHAYNIDFLNVVFAASSIFLLLSVFWMVWDDFDRDWKNTQRRFTSLEMQVTNQQLQLATAGVDREQLQLAQQQRAAARQAVAANGAKVDELQDVVDELDARLGLETQNYQFAKATYDVNRYAFEVRRDAGRAGPEEEAAIAEQAAMVAGLNLAVETTTAERVEAQAALGKFTAQVGEAQAQIDELLTERRRLMGRMATISPSLVKTLFLDAPMTDFLAPTIKVQQIVLPTIMDDVNFMRVAKMDRCQTCHLAIDTKGYEEYPQPFRTHSNLSQYLGSDSPHPLNQIGCTVCHDGMGQSVDFTLAAHTPQNVEQEKEWEELYDWAPKHDWDYPMLPVGMTEASCVKCHREEAFVPGANVLGDAYATFERAGCYACHKVRGFEGLRKPGPSLTRLQGKLDPQWVADWIRDPKTAKPATWMPQIWYNSNSSSPEDALRNEVEISSVVTYLFENSEEFSVPSPPPPGDIAAGRQLVENVGCLGCHITTETDRSAAGPRRTFGQPLQGVGAKTNYPWIYDWVRNPKHYSPSTFMPDLRLSEKEAADVAAYLTTLGGKAFGPPTGNPDRRMVDVVLLDYLKTAMPAAAADAQLASMDDHAKDLELGRRAIARYGCFSCHDIKGFEDTQPIGVELSEEASKLVTRLDFAFEDIHHTKMEWFEHKLANPRSFDRGRILAPLDRLRMPDFHLSEHENQLLRTAIMSFQRYIQPAAALPPGSARKEFLTAGRGFVQRRNCVGCHVVEGAGGDYQTVVAEASLAPPLLTPEGSRVQPDWLYRFLRSPISIRPWLDVRMPSFGLDDEHWNQAISYFQAIPDAIRPFQTFEPAVAGANTATGEVLFDTLKCQQCHVLGDIPADQPTANLAPDLRMAWERLNPEWIADWMRVPLRIVPGTRMPGFWPNLPQSDFPEFDGDGELQIEAIRDHIMTFRGGPSPKRSGN